MSRKTVILCQFLVSDYFVCYSPLYEAGSHWSNLYSTNFPGNYLNSESCGLQIHSAYGVHLEIVSFYLELYDDKVKVYDGADENAPLLATYTGQVASGKVVSSGEYLYITYNTDDWTTRSGFHMRFTSG